MLLTEIQKTYRKKGRKIAEKESLSWYRDGRDSDDDFSVARMNPQKGYLQPGKIHIFTYNPKGKGVLDYYDKKPVVISIGRIKRGNQFYDLGINLNFIPYPYKWYIMDAIKRLYNGFFRTQSLSRNSGNALTQANIKYKYNVLKKLLSDFGFEFAIRQYIPSRKSRVYVVSYESWENVAFLTLENFEGITYNEMVRQFKQSKR